MPIIPDKRALGQIRVNGRATPEQINPAVAYDIGRAGQAMNQAMHQIAAAFSGLGEKQAAMDDAAWLSQAKIDTLTADDTLRRDTEKNAGVDGTGFEQAPTGLKGVIDEVEKRPGGSAEARFKYKLWGAERTFETGRWAVDSAQKRLKDSTNIGLEKRLTELTNLASSNPDRALEYFRAYDEEVRSKVGFAITAPEAEQRIIDARTNILKASIATKAKVAPGDLGKAIGALEGAGLNPLQRFDDVNTETRGLRPAGGARHPASVSFKLETGTDDPMRGVKNISRDAGGTKSYGNLGINSGGSAQQFRAKYGEQFGLTAEPGTTKFDEQWRNAAGAAPVELHAAELEWWDDTIGSKVVTNLKNVGVSSDVANDPRVKAYFADRSVQYGPAAIGNHGARVKAAFEKSGGSPEKFLSEMSKADRGKMQGDFPTALASGVYSQRGHNNRIAGRESRALGINGEGNIPTQPELEVDKSKAPTVDGSIQPAELLELSRQDYRAIVQEMRPFLEADIETRMNKAVSSITAKGSQNVITPQELDDLKPLVGPKAVESWKQSLTDNQEMYVATTTIKQMTPEQRNAQLRALVPTGRIEDLAEADARRFEIWSKGVREINQRIKKDALGFFSQEHEGGRQAMKMIADAAPDESGTPAREQAIDTIITLQRREGIPPNEVRVLTDEQATQLVTRLKEAKTGPAAMGTIEGYRLTYGKHFNQLWNEMVGAGAPQSYLSLKTATRKGQDALVQSYALENAMSEGGKKEGRNGLLIERAGVKQTDLSAAVTNEISQFVNTLQHKTSSARLVESYRSAAERVAAYYVITEGKSVSDAAKQAANDLFSANLKVVKGAAIPADVYARDGHHIERTMTYDIGQLIEQQEQQIVAPIRPGKGLQAGHEHERYINSIKRYPNYVSNENSTGVYLLDENEDYVLVDTADGPVPLFYTWEQLAKVRPHSFGRDNPFLFR